MAADFARTIGLELTDDESPAEPADLVEAANLVVRRSVQTNHPYFLNQNYAGADPLGVVGDWLGAALNTTNATFEVAPVFTMIERALLAKMARLVGFPESGDHPAGLMCAGRRSRSCMRSSSPVTGFSPISSRQVPTGGGFDPG